MDSVRDIPDDKWLAMLTESVRSHVVEGIEFPRFPSNDLQTMFVGSANEETLREAFAFYRFVKDTARNANNPVRRDGRFLDFGCGWGRFLRFFWKDVAPENLFGCDVNERIVDVCRDTNVPGNISLIHSLGSLPYPSSHFNTMMAYSVFTHLPEAVHMHWVRELARVAQEDCIFCLTLEPRRFMDFIASIPAGTKMQWCSMLAEHKPRLREWNHDFDAGRFVFMPTNKGIEDVYGDAVVPLAFVETHWSPYFEILEYVDDASRFWQAVLVVRRTHVGV